MTAIARPAYGIGLDLGIEIAAVDQRKLQLTARSGGECGIIDYRSLPDTTQPPVVPFGAVASGKAVGRKLQFRKAENLVVWCLSEKVVKLGLAHIIAVGDIHSHPVEKILPVGDMLGSAARTERHHDDSSGKTGPQAIETHGFTLCLIW